MIKETSRLQKKFYSVWVEENLLINGHSSGRHCEVISSMRTDGYCRLRSTCENATGIKRPWCVPSGHLWQSAHNA